MAVAVTPLVGEMIDKYASLQEEGDRVPRARFGRRGCVLRKIFEDSVQEIKEFDVREDDVWVVTPPKCGTTWAQEMVWLLVHDLDYKTAKENNLMMRFPYMEFSRFITEKTRKEYLKGLDTVQHAASLTPPRCIKSHLPKDLLPDQIWTKKPKIIYVAREPKDTAVSFFYHNQLLSDYRGDKEFFFECFYEDIVGYAPFWEHMLDFWQLKDEPHILFHTYEEMKKDLPSVIRRSAKFLGKNLTEEQVLRLAEHLDFKQMKVNPSVNIEEKLSKMREEGKITEEQAFIRKGVVGEGRREMSPEMAARFDERTRRVFNEAVGGCPWKI
ncbi:Putative sulfotransferase domain protein [Gryllus bimaculatus]|nr:Putative sulfotransferase domain protein [Gryllus bimaculatus]